MTEKQPPKTKAALEQYARKLADEIERQKEARRRAEREFRQRQKARGYRTISRYVPREIYDEVADMIARRVEAYEKKKEALRNS